jgi:peptide-methionine (S)-S-oxide reductase
LGCLRGVVRTRVGYTGGTTAVPTYRSIGDHAETVQADFDPGTASFEELLDIFWSAHDPTRRAWSRQYMSAVFYAAEDQEREARASKERQERLRGKTIATEILPASAFYLAEDYHQKYLLQNDDILNREFRRIYPDFAEFVASTAAARVNGYLYGCGSLEELRTEMGSFGLSPRGTEHLLERVGARRC